VHAPLACLARMSTAARVVYQWLCTCQREMQTWTCRSLNKNMKMCSSSDTLAWPYLPNLSRSRAPTSALSFLCLPPTDNQNHLFEVSHLQDCYPRNCTQACCMSIGFCRCTSADAPQSAVTSHDSRATCEGDTVCLDMWRTDQPFPIKPPPLIA
jgi:hypothetical protein